MIPQINPIDWKLKGSPMDQEEVFLKKKSFHHRKNQAQAHSALKSATLVSFKPLRRDLTKELLQKFPFSGSTWNATDF